MSILGPSFLYRADGGNGSDIEQKKAVRRAILCQVKWCERLMLNYTLGILCKVGFAGALRSHLLDIKHKEKG